MGRRRLLVLSALLLSVGATAVGCAAPAPSVEVGDSTVIIDVRTPEEFASGHLEGAENVDLQSGAFEAEISEYALDGEYVVYCRSGNRSAQAAALMDSLGFEDVTDAGGLNEAAQATGLPIVSG
jgi:rhodanese-related sulfurtransferase